MTSNAHGREYPGCRVVAIRDAGRALEFKTFQYPLTGAVAAELPGEPGAVVRTAGGDAKLLHHGPGTFLVPDPDASLERTLALLEQAGIGAVFDVGGKWRRFRLTGPSSARLLASGIDLEQCLQRRDCAAVHLFDSPAILLLQPVGFDVWVHASYAEDFGATLDRLGQRLGTVPRA
jgi:sarcosine oxidase gamma subunit